MKELYLGMGEKRVNNPFYWRYILVSAVVYLWVINILYGLKLYLVKMRYYLGKTTIISWKRLYSSVMSKNYILSLETRLPKIWDIFCDSHLNLDINTKFMTYHNYQTIISCIIIKYMKSVHKDYKETFLTFLWIIRDVYIMSLESSRKVSSNHLFIQRHK